MFVEWFARRQVSAVQEAEGGQGSLVAHGIAESTPPLLGGKAGHVARPYYLASNLNGLAGFLRRTLRGAAAVLMLAPVVLIPAYFFISALMAPPPARPRLGSEPIRRLALGG